MKKAKTQEDFDSSKTCKNCRFWKYHYVESEIREDDKKKGDAIVTFSQCILPTAKVLGFTYPTLNFESFFYIDAKGGVKKLFTGRDFGCIHFSKR